MQGSSSARNYPGVVSISDLHQRGPNCNSRLPQPGTVRTRPRAVGGPKRRCRPAQFVQSTRRRSAIGWQNRWSGWAPRRRPGPDRRGHLSSTVIPLRQSAVERSLKQRAFDTAGVPLHGSISGQILAIYPSTELIGGGSCGRRSVAEALANLSHALRHAAQRLWSAGHGRSATSSRPGLPLRSGHAAECPLRRAAVSDSTRMTFGVDIDRPINCRTGRTPAVTWGRSACPALAEHQSQLTIVLNADRRVIYANAALEPITGEHEGRHGFRPFESSSSASRIDFRRAVDRCCESRAGDASQRRCHLGTRARAGLAMAAACRACWRTASTTQCSRLVLTARDLGPAERRQARRLRLRERLLRLAIQQKSDFTHGWRGAALDGRSARRERASFWRLTCILTCSAAKLFSSAADASCATGSVVNSRPRGFPRSLRS